MTKKIFGKICEKWEYVISLFPMKKTPRISDLKMRMIVETLKDFKCLLPRYREVKGDELLLKEFCSRNRNPLWDITQIKYFYTGLSSKGLIENGGKPVKEHYIPRVKATEIIFSELDMNLEMDVETFISLIKKYASTISITKDEHKRITGLTKGKDVMNYVMYEQAGIEVPGLEEYIL
jgi:hypothetical protein